MPGMSTPVIVTEHSPAFWRVTFDNPPLNLLNPEAFAALRHLVERLESDDQVRVVLFDSANPDYFIAHLDMHRLPEVPDVPGAADFAEAWPDLSVRLSRLPQITIAAIRGRCRGIGSEFALACDIRFASRERAIFCQTEVGAGHTVGGGGIEWLTRLVGRSRALEIVASSDDYDATTAELYGWVNRAVPDAQFETFVENFAHRLAGFDRRPIEAAKAVVNERSTPLPTEADIRASWEVFVACLEWPEARARLELLVERGLQQPGDYELRLGHHIGQLSATPGPGRSRGPGAEARNAPPSPETTTSATKLP